MKSKKRHQSSSDDSEDSAQDSVKSSSSGSVSEGSSVVEHRHKKKRKRDDSTDSGTDSEDQKHSKKRKHKKKKKKHGKKKRRSGSVESHSGEDVSSISEGQISPKKKRKHKRKRSKRARSASAHDKDKERDHHCLSSVVKEPQASSDEEGQPARTYYQKEYRRSASPEEFEREREVQRFYRGSSKERRQHHEQYQHEREPNDRYAHQDRYDRGREKYGQQEQHNHNEEYGRRQRDFNEYKRNPRFEERRLLEEDFRRRPREDYHSREEPRGFNRFNQYEERGPKRRDFDDGRDFRERRGPPPPDRFREREYPDRKERIREERFSPERTRDIRRERPPGRPDKPPPPNNREIRARSGSADERYRDRGRRENKDGRGERPRDHLPKPKDRKSRFADADENKEYDWGKTEVNTEDGKPQDKEKPNFALSGKLTEDANTVNGVVIKYSEPDDAKQPKRRWRFYPFKGDKALPILYIHRQSAFLIGRDKKVVDIALEHPSISKQHAALQFRATPFTRPDGSQGRRVRPYIIDLDSANGTFVNNKKVEGRRYVELLERDVVKFGFSQRDYVLLHENSKDDAQDDDQEPPEAVPPSTDLIKLEKRLKQEIAEDGE